MAANVSVAAVVTSVVASVGTAEVSTGLSSAVMGATVGGAAVGGAGLFGASVYGFYSIDKLTCEYNKVKEITNTLDASLKSLKAEQQKQTTRRKIKQNKVNKILNLKKV